MATKNTTTEGRVKITIPRARAGEDPNLLVGVNGVITLIPKGQTVEVTPAVAFEVERAQAAESFMYAESDARKVNNPG